MKEINLNTLDLNSNCKSSHDNNNLTDRLTTDKSSNSARSTLTTHKNSLQSNSNKLFANQVTFNETYNYLSDESDVEYYQEELEAIRIRRLRALDDSILNLQRENLQDTMEAIESSFKKLNDRANRIEHTARYVNEKQSRVNSEITENLNFISEMRAHVKMLLEKQSRIGRNYPDIQRYIDDERRNSEFNEYTRVETPQFKPKRQDINVDDFTDDDDYYGSREKSTKQKSSSYTDNSYLDEEERNDKSQSHKNNDYDVENEETRQKPIKMDTQSVDLANGYGNDYKDDDINIDYNENMRDDSIDRSNDLNNDNQSDNHNDVNGVKDDLINGNEVYSDDNISYNSKSQVHDDDHIESAENSNVIEIDSKNGNSVTVKNGTENVSVKIATNIDAQNTQNDDIDDEYYNEENTPSERQNERRISEELTEEERLIVERLKMRLLEEEQKEGERQNQNGNIDADGDYDEEIAREMAMAELKKLEEEA